MIPCLVHNVHSQCLFPKYLQSYEGAELAREWFGHITRHNMDKSHSYSYIVTFQGGLMRAAVSGGWKLKHPPKPYTRECIQEVMPGRFLVSHKESGFYRDKFTCMQFLLRSPDVIQLKISHLADEQMARLCEDGALVLDPWPYTNRVNLYKSYIPCPLQGGFNIRIFDKAEGLGICDAFNGETRLESECMQGEGMYFRYRHDNCVPKDIHMHKNQRVYCIASWNQGDNTFTILRHENNNHQWCFRQPKRLGTSFIAFLFKDLICDSNDFPNLTEDYLQLDMTRDIARPLAFLCSDDYEACNMWSNPCRHAGSVMHLACARTCGICSDSRPATCTMPGKLQGDWLDTSANDKQVVRISDMFLTVGDFRQMQCIRWNQGYMFTDSNSTEEMLVTTFDNGCRPRYQCAHFQKRTSSILRFKLSQSQIWPFEGTTGSFIECSQFKYRDDDPPFNDKWRSRHFKVLVSTTDHRYTDCQLGDTKRFDVVFADGLACNGSISQDYTSSNTKMKLSLPRCPRQPIEQEFACLDSWKHGYLGDHMIVSEALDISSDLRCWLFAAGGETFYLLPASQCNEGIKDQITLGTIVPIATFTVRLPKYPFGLDSKVILDSGRVAVPDKDSEEDDVEEIEVVNHNDLLVRRRKPPEKPKERSAEAGASSLQQSLCLLLWTAYICSKLVQR